MKKPLDCSSGAGIDLHIHSTASDGTTAPMDIVAVASALGLKAIAITDHDTIDGAKKVLSTGTPKNLEFLTGIEISALPPPSFKVSGSIHILGYGIDLNNPPLNECLESLKQARDERNPKIIHCLNQLGMDLTLDDVTREVGSGVTGRPHIAIAMVKKGFADSINDAFDRFLGKGQPAYVDKFRIKSAKAMELIKGAGGIPVLAHPYLIGIHDPHRFESFLTALKSMGLMGIEVLYPEHTPKAVAFYARLAEKHSLLITGGSDFHGEIKKTVQMGSGNGDLFVPYELYEKLMHSLSK